VPKRLVLALPDAELCQQLAKKIFAPAGFGVTQALNCSELRGAVRSKTPDLILMADQLPHGSALALAEEIKRAHPDLPIILTSKRGKSPALSSLVRQGIAEVVSFPPARKETLAAIDHVLDRTRLLQRWVKREAGRSTGDLRRRLAELETILKQIDDGVLVLDQNSHILMMNRALRRDFGVEGEDLIGEPVERLFQDREIVQALSDKNHGGERLEVQNALDRVFDVRISHVSDIGTVASLHDITYLKELDRLRRDFVNTVSHDLRSPLTAILGYVELIERAGEVNPQQQQFIQRVKSSVHATTGLIDDLLNLGRVEVGLVDEVVPVDLKLVVANALSALQPRVREKNQTVKMGRIGSLSPARGNRVQLGQVVDNLIGNAIKYTQEGGEIRVKLREEGNQLILQVEDNGPGIPVEEQGRIFEKFYRASNTEHGVPGTGLGLAIVKTIVDNHRGRIWVDSKPGEGSVFTVVLPLPVEK
jgi:PAS domain S-box-containing protein